MKPWHFRYARGMVYAGASVAAVAVAGSAAWDQWPDLGRTLVEARQLYGLWALGLLLASVLLGPLTSVLPWLPLKPSILYARRAVGIGALCFGMLHVVAYLWSLVRRDWRELYSPGVIWTAGIVLGVLALADMVALGVTSTDRAVRRMGGRRWKRLHRTVYVLGLVVLAHTVMVGADFGVNHGPDVTAPADAGALIGFACLTMAWAILFVLRHRGVRWVARPYKAWDG